MQYTSDGLLTHFIDPRNNASQLTYDNLGRLQTDMNAAGGGQTLVRNEKADGYAVTRTTMLNRMTAYSIQNLPTGNLRRTVITPTGLLTETLFGTNGSTHITVPDRTVIDTLEGPDPRFGMQAPITTQSTITSGGLTKTINHNITVNPSQITDPLAFTSLTRTLTINGRTSTSVNRPGFRRGSLV